MRWTASRRLLSAACEEWVGFAARSQTSGPVRSVFPAIRTNSYPCFPRGESARFMILSLEGCRRNLTVTYHGQCSCHAKPTDVASGGAKPCSA